MKTVKEIFETKNLTSGRLIRALRVFNQISQPDFAKICDLSQSTISRLERGDSELTKEDSLKIAAFFNIDPSKLLFPNGFEKEKEFITVKNKVAKLEKLNLRKSLTWTRYRTL